MAKKAFIAHELRKGPDNESVVEKLYKLDEEERRKIVEHMLKTNYADTGMDGFEYDWDIWARGNQKLSFIPTDDWATAAYIAGRGFGKLLPLNTPLYTKSGWKSNETIKVGDEVIDETGNWCKVTGVYAPEIPKKAYRLHFNDGSTMDAGEEHYWFSWTHQNRKQYLRNYKEKYGKSASEFPDNWINYCPEPELVKEVLEYCKEGDTKGVSKHIEKVLGKTVNPVTVKSILAGNYKFGIKKTTQEIVDTFYHSTRKDANHCIPNVKPLNLDAQSLPIHPKILGYWLANGISNSEKFSAHQDDIPFLVSEFESLGYSCEYTPEKDNQQFKVNGIRQHLKDLGIFSDKKTPTIYLESSIQQRLDLLSGFMTGDGGVDGASCVSYTSSRKGLADDVYWLVVSLGMKAYVDTRIPTYSYKGKKLEGQLSYRINFVPTQQVFFLPRKAEQLNFECEQLLKRRHRMIVKYEEIEPVTMRCISVDSPNGAYCAGRQLLVTSNTRVGAELVRHFAENELTDEIGLIGRTANDVIGTMLTGPSGILNRCPPWNRPTWHRSDKTITWPNKVRARYFTAQKPDQLRGPQFGMAWCDEPAAWQYSEAFDQVMMCLRLPLKDGRSPKCVVTTTPRPTKMILDLVADPTTWTIVGSTRENAANIDVKRMFGMFEGTTLGRQELEAELLVDVEGALWKQDTIDDTRLSKYKDRELVPMFLKTVVAVDPAMSTKTNSAETGFCVASISIDNHIYIQYCESFKMHPDEWAKHALELYDEYRADQIVCEINNGGELVVNNIAVHRPLAPIYTVWASKGKHIRAEPVATLYERKRVHHMGIHAQLENQMTSFDPREVGKTQLLDCMDAMVWAVTALMEFSATGSEFTALVGGKRTKLIDYIKMPVR